MNQLLQQSSLYPAKWSNLNVNSVQTKTLTTDTLNLSTLTVNTLISTNDTINTLNSTNGTIDTLNSTNGTIDNLTTHNIEFGGIDGRPISYQMVESIDDFPPAVGNVITLLPRAYFVTSIMDLQGKRLVFPQNSSLAGTSLETSGFKSTGLPSGESLITCNYTLPLQNIRLESSEPNTTVFNLDATGNPSQSLDWTFVNIYNSPNIGTIKNFNNFIAFTMGFLNSSNLIFDGTDWGTISFTTSIFTPPAGQTALILPNTCTVSRRFRVLYSAFVVPPTSSGINFMANVPDSGYILDSISFTAGGTYLVGTSANDNKAAFSGCRGIQNSAEIGQYYLTVAAPTTISNTTSYFPLAGTTTAGAFNQRFTTSNNLLTYIGTIVKPFRVTGSVSLTSGNNNVVEIVVLYNGSPLAGSLQSTTTNASGRSENISFFGTVQLSQNDTIRVAVKNTTSATNVTAISLNVIVTDI